MTDTPVRDLEFYQEWIWNKWQDESGYAKCMERSHEMHAEFPELTLRRGFYYCFSWGRRTHWWLTMADGTVVDPTARQFPSGGSGVYEALEEHELPTGVCQNCGEYTFENKEFCDSECYDEAVAELNAARREAGF